jgi:hypothetical protein
MHPGQVYIARRTRTILSLCTRWPVARQTERLGPKLQLHSGAVGCTHSFSFLGFLSSLGVLWYFTQTCGITSLSIFTESFPDCKDASTPSNISRRTFQLGCHPSSACRGPVLLKVQEKIQKIVQQDRKFSSK